MTVATFKDIINIKCNLAPRQLDVLDIPNKNTQLIKDLLDRNLKYSDRGIEVGSSNYISNSPNYFIRAKALQPEYFLPFWNDESVLCVRPQVFKNYNLKEGDILISKDSNIGEVIILDKDYPNYMISGALYKLPISKNKFYLFAFLKHSYFRKQLDLMVPTGSTIRHAKTLFLDCKIPFPNQKNSDEVIKYVEQLTQAIFFKEKEMRKKNRAIFNIIEEELVNNQKNEQFQYLYPKIKNISDLNRVNAGIYSEYFCKNNFLIKNYHNGSKTIKQLGFDVSRGQNLQISCIGKSIYSKEYKKNFYTVIKPMHISTFGTAFSQEYLGNSKKLKTLKEGDIIFGAEGFQKGRSIVILKDEDKTITNIHGITINHSHKDIRLSIFVKCFLDYLREIGLIDLLAVGGNGGSLAMKYWDYMLIPLFPKKKQDEISKYYHNNTPYPTKLNLSNFISNDKEWNKKAGIIELDQSIKTIREQLDYILSKIVSDEKVEISFESINYESNNIS